MDTTRAEAHLAQRQANVDTSAIVRLANNVPQQTPEGNLLISTKGLISTKSTFGEEGVKSSRVAVLVDRIIQALKNIHLFGFGSFSVTKAAKSLSEASRNTQQLGQELSHLPRESLDALRRASLAFFSFVQAKSLANAGNHNYQHAMTFARLFRDNVNTAINTANELRRGELQERVIQASVEQLTVNDLPRQAPIAPSAASTEQAEEVDPTLAEAARAALFAEAVALGHATAPVGTGRANVTVVQSDDDLLAASQANHNPSFTFADNREELTRAQAYASTDRADSPTFQQEADLVLAINTQTLGRLSKSRRKSLEKFATANGFGELNVHNVQDVISASRR